MSKRTFSVAQVWKTKVSDIWRNYARSKPGVLGLTIIAVFSLVAMQAPHLAPYDPRSVDMTNRLRDPLTQYILGADQFGRDILSRLIFGTRVSLLVGFFAAGLSGLLGVTIGSISGFYGGRLDGVVMRIVDIFLSIPSFFLILVLVAVFGPSIGLITIVIGLTMWPTTARLIRAEFLSIKEREFVSAARMSGASATRIMFVEVLPNGIHPAIVNLSLLIAGSILYEASLSFLGMGDPNAISWGGMLNDALPYFRSAWWVAVFPGMAISVTVVAFNLMGDALNDALNPRLRRL